MKHGHQRRIGVMAASALILLAAATGSASQKEEERVTRSVPISVGGQLKLKNFSGKVIITGTDRADVAIDAVRRAPRERLDHIKLEIESSGSVVTIDANRRDDSWRKKDNNVVETTFTIEVPRNTKLDLSVFSSDVTVDGVTGAVQVDGFSSAVKIADATEAVKVKTFSGDVDVSMAASATQPELDIDTFSGDVQVRLSASTAGRISFRSFSGQVDSDVPLLLRSQGRGRLSADLNSASSGSNTLNFHTFSGSVRIRK